MVRSRAGVFWLCTIGLIGLGAAARVFSVASSISVDKEWATIVSGGDEGKLSQMNGIMRRIDLFCKLVAPALTGVGWGFVGGTIGTLFVSAWNCVSYLFEVRLLANVFDAVLVLQGARRGNSGRLRGKARTGATATATATANGHMSSAEMAAAVGPGGTGAALEEQSVGLTVVGASATDA